MRSQRAVMMTAAVVLASGCTTSTDDAAVDARHYYDEYAGQLAESAPTFTGSADAALSIVPTDPGVLEDNTFVDAGTSGFVDPRESPLSTFAVDVDTGSYRVARTLLREGHLPPPESVRVEEWVNAFDNGFFAPERGDLELRSDQALAPSAGDGTRLVRIGLQAREVEQEDWPPVALTMVVDTSGSMDIRERLGLVKSSLALLVDHLRPSDTIAIVTYESNAAPLLEPTPVRETERILDAIEQLTPGGSTNLEAGLLLGYDKAREAYRPGATNVVLLASDGVANVGVTDGSRLASAISDNGRRGIHLVTVGYGMGNYNDHLMEQLADQGDGFYAYVDTFAEAKRLYVDDLRTTLTPVAEDVKIQVEFDPGTVSAYRLIGYENRALDEEDFDNEAADAGEVGAGHTVTALYEVRPTAQADVGDALGGVKVRWRTVEGDDQREDSLTLVLGKEQEPQGALGVAAVVADLAHYVKHRDSEAGLGPLRRRIDTLLDQGADGAPEVAALLEEVTAAR